jgi:hypothetical protein
VIDLRFSSCFSRDPEFWVTGRSLPRLSPAARRWRASSSNRGLSRAATRARWLSVRWRRCRLRATTNASGEPQSTGVLRAWQLRFVQVAGWGQKMVCIARGGDPPVSCKTPARQVHTTCKPRARNVQTTCKECGRRIAKHRTRDPFRKPPPKIAGRGAGPGPGSASLPSRRWIALRRRAHGARGSLTICHTSLARLALASLPLRQNGRLRRWPVKGSLP